METRSKASFNTSYKKEPAGSWEGLYVGMESKGTKSTSDFNEMRFESDEQTGNMFQDDSSLDVKQSTYQLHNKYVVSTIKSGMLVIDQHRAHQRILYENFLKHITIKESVSQQLLFPVLVFLSQQEMDCIKEVQEDLEHTGFVFANFHNDHIEISGVPISVPESEVTVILEQLISDIENEVPDTHFSATDLLAKSMAKSLAIKRGQSLSLMEQEHLVNSLFACKDPNSSPTNHATFVTISVDEIDKKFI